MDDFSFPAIQTDTDTTCNLPFPHFAASPLWFLSSVSDEKARYRRSFSSAEEAAKVADALSVSALSDDEGARKKIVSKEEKMDMLWEDFNDELYQLSREWKPKDAKGKSGTVRGSDQAFGMPKGGRSLLPHRRPSLVVMLKVLKKMFLIQKNGSSKKVIHLQNISSVN